MTPAVAAAVAALSRATGSEYRELPSGEVNGPCPVCDAGKGKHLYLTAGDQCGVVGVCFKGCAWSSIRPYLGLTESLSSDRFTPTTRTMSSAEILHDYKNVDGTLAVQVVRRGRGPGKKIYQRQPKEGGGWDYALNGALPPLYRLPELCAAPSGSTVYLVEGEPDADALAALGLVATTSIRGTSGWTARYCAYFLEHPVIILPDHDTPGVKLAKTRLADLTAAGIAAKIVWLGFRITPSHGKDVSDWLAEGHTRADLEALAAAPSPEPELPPRRYVPLTVEEYLEKPKPAPLVGGLLEVGELAVIYGLSAAGKTFFVLDLALHLTQGKPWRGRPVKRSRVLYVHADGGRGFGKRLLAWERVNGTSGRANLRIIDGPVGLFDPESAATFLAEVKGDEPPWDVIIFDTLSPCITGADEISTRDMGQVAGVAKRLVAETAAAVWIVAHSTKDGLSLRGVLTLKNDSTTTIQVTRSEERIKVVCEKSKNDRAFSEMFFNLFGVEDSCVLVEISEPNPLPGQKEITKADLLALVKESPGCTREDLTARLSIPYRSLCRYVMELLEEGLIERAERPCAAGLLGRPAFGLYPRPAAWR